MENLLRMKLQSYLVHHNPEVILNFEGKTTLSKYIDDKLNANRALLESLYEEQKPMYIIEELCMNELTKDLRPSRFQYLRGILEDEFEEQYLKLRESGMLTYEVVNLITACKQIFEGLTFTEETEHSRVIRYAAIGFIEEYFLEENS